MAARVKKRLNGAIITRGLTECFDVKTVCGVTYKVFPPFADLDLCRMYNFLIRFLFNYQQSAIYVNLKMDWKDLFLEQ